MVHIDSKITSLKEMIDEITAGITNETKSTLGDKHETTRVMMQLEQEKLQKQLQELVNQKAGLEKLAEAPPALKIANGSLVETDKGLIYLGAAIGKIMVEGKPVIAISVQSPLGIQLVGKTIGDKIEMNGMVYEIQSIF